MFNKLIIFCATLILMIMGITLVNKAKEASNDQFIYY